MVAKCGEERIWHWAHQGTRTCDSWWEPETEWHRAWKGKFPIAWQEVIHPAENGEKHIADVKTDHGWVIEFQYSFIKPDERRSRNAFYPKLVWVVNGTRRKRDRAQFLRACEHGVPLRKDSPVRPGKALMLVAEENRDDISRRLHAIRQAVKHTEAHGRSIKQRVGVLSVRGMDWRLHYHDETGDLQETERVQYLIDEVKALGDVRLLVFDPLVAFNGANENDNMEMSRLMFALDRIAETTGAAVLVLQVLHHVSKGGQIRSLNEATQTVVRGASALVDNARAAMLLTRIPRSDAALYGVRPDEAGRFVVVRVVKNNYGPHVPDVVFSVEGGGALRYAPEVERAHDNAAQAGKAQEEEETSIRILRALHENPKASQRLLGVIARVSATR
jgi:hypothetical protein